jgi:hypothetical protein
MTEGTDKRRAYLALATAIVQSTDRCAECRVSLPSCETKRWLGGRPCCDGCSHPQPDATLPYK